MRKKKKHTHKLFLTIFVVVFLQKEEITLLQISNEKLNGVGLESLSYTELTSLESKLTEGLRIVDEQTDKAHLELLHLQSVECDVMGSDWVNQKGKDDMAYQSLLAKRRRELRNKARELRLSPPKETQQHYSYYPETLMSDIDSLKMEKKRLRLLNQRMIGQGLDGMDYYELYVLSFQILRAMKNSEDMKINQRAKVQI
ncbi:uncharacterized protein LOC108852650 isoform X8 [Raphanus sativus]|uniref:Uncharacterized protein LOC108852650 isoform X8 n=1 Tax=Raphanus sativus TaxID=3726 RepID=A0A9W3DGI9_RAPSA|nr:uncharacterized protein LOC108852650 isoform X8 [Raphanus sativus]XP_056862857.1 uncharacterized protein LOC108852650 isoform X8 [Raphanus sativus]